MSHTCVRSIALLVTFALALAACGGSPPPTAGRPTDAPPTAVPSDTAPTTAPAPVDATAEPNATGILNGVTLPPDAAPPEQQFFVIYYDNTADFTSIDLFETVYKRGNSLLNLHTEPLIRLNKEYEILPAAATKWEVDQSGLIWTFHLDPNLIWSDDSPLTADDYVATFRYGADPKHNWDFKWFFNGTIKHWEDVVAGKKPVAELGVTAVDAHTLQFETQTPAPYLPAMLLYSYPMQKKALAHYGGLYNSDPATAVSSGPYILKEWRKGDHLIYEANPKYKGSNKPYIQKMIAIGAAPSTMFAGYLAGEVDFVGGGNLSAADNELVLSDPKLKQQYRQGQGDFQTHYLFFDSQNPPFNDLKVRQAFSHAIDRETIINTTLTANQAIPAYSYLMPGFPAANQAALKPIQQYDVAKARELLAEAGYPSGKGFPKLTLWLRNASPARQSFAQEITTALKQNLGINVEIANKENKVFNAAMNAKPTQIQFGMVSYGMDFLDPYNMLSVWLQGGRHNWNNSTFDEIVKKAGAFTGDPAERTKLFQQAEQLLVEDVGGVFLFHLVQSRLFKPYLKGSELEPDKSGFATFHFPTLSSGSSAIGSMYISKDVANYPRKLP